MNHPLYFHLSLFFLLRTRKKEKLDVATMQEKIVFYLHLLDKEEWLEFGFLAGTAWC